MFQRFSIGLAGAAVLAALSTGPAQAGMKVLTHFANLSPYTAKIEFPRGMQDCWNDTGAEYDRHDWWHQQTKGMDLHAYEESFRMDMVSPAGHEPYMKHFKGVYGISDLADLKTLSMDNTSISLPAGRAGEKVEMALIRGETSAGASCKFKKSSRGFVITLLDAQSQVISRNHYEIRDPAGGPWTLSRWSPEDPEVGELITLGSGGQGRPVEVGLATVGAVITVASLGSMAAEWQAVRALYRRIPGFLQTTAHMARVSVATAEAHMMRNFFIGQRLATSRRLTMNTGLRSIQEFATPHRTMPIQLLLTGVADGLLYFARPDPTVQEMDNLVGMNTAELLEGIADPEFEFEDPVLRLMAGLPEKIGDRSICLIEGDVFQFGVRICDVVGITLDILPNGSLVVSPLPSVGDGIRHLGFL
ncbi:MAG: hypothetical protein M0R28_03350 [Pigmentiphaga sp.]|nr:hypothetical protein [Pigmentiphaga sp.]